MMYENNLLLFWQPLYVLDVIKELSEVEQLEKITFP